MNRQPAKLPRIASLKYTMLTAALLPSLAQAQAIEGYQQMVIDAYNEAFSGICEPARQALKPGDENLAPGAVALEADQTELEGQNLLIFTGNAELEQNGMHINADRLSYDRSKDLISGQGNIRIQDPLGNVFEAESVEMEAETAFGTATNVNYTIADTSRKTDDPEAAYIRAHGTAEVVDFEGHDLVTLKNATYSTCRKDKEIAVLTAEKIEVDKIAGVGKGKNVKLRLKDVPVFWFPYVSFPLNDDRKSGFLMPSFGSTTRSGSVFKLPYYWNIAPNMDATFAGKYYSKRGTQLQGEYRYLSDKLNGNLLGEYLADDKETGDNRWGFHFDHRQTLSQRWRASLDYTEVSDANYFEDFSDELRYTSATFLPQNIALNYAGNWLRADARYSRYQTIDDTIPEASQPYDRAPQIILRTNLPDVNDFKFDAYLGYDNFQRDDRISGPRTDLTASVAYDYKKIYGFIKPKATLRYTAYSLEDVPAGQPTDPDRSLGLFSLDSGLFFDRPTLINDKDFTATLEPRLFYLYVPYENQDDIPLFDTGESTFGIGNLFRENRFTGPDRIGDANQLTVALTSRLLRDGDGAELMRGSIGQIYYFSDRKVSLVDDAPPVTAGSSDFVGELYTKLGRMFYMYNFLEWDTEESEISSFKTDLRYARDVRRRFDLSYYYSSFGTDQVNAALAWPLHPRWQLTADARYDIEESNWLNGGLAIGYSACCWGVRVGGKRRVDNTSEYVNSVYLEFEINGLTKIRSSF